MFSETRTIVSALDYLETIGADMSILLNMQRRRNSLKKETSHYPFLFA